MEAYLAVRPAMTMLSVADASLGSPLAADVGGCGSRELPSRSGRVEPDDAPPPPASTASLESSALLGALACGLPDVFLSEVLTRLGAHDRAMLARACRGARACVLASGLPRAGVPPPRDDDENEAETTRVHHHPHPPFSASHFTRTLRLTRWGLANGMPLHWRTAEHAAAHGSVDVMRCLRSAESTPPCPWNWRACAKAAERGERARDVPREPAPLRARPLQHAHVPRLRRSRAHAPVPRHAVGPPPPRQAQRPAARRHRQLRARARADGGVPRGARDASEHRDVVRVQPRQDLALEHLGQHAALREALHRAGPRARGARASPASGEGGAEVATFQRQMGRL